jgi:uncharacterized protein
MALTKVPWIRPGIVVHEPSQPIDGLLSQFALTIRERGFRVAGYVQRNNLGAHDLGHGCAANIELEDLATSDILTVDSHDDDSVSVAVGSLHDTARGGADLVIVSRFSAFEKTVGGMSQVLAQSVLGGTPVLTSIAGRCLQRYLRHVRRQGAD